jgi:CubicO group peptidase (beta-lactamase class C family)
MPDESRSLPSRPNLRYLKLEAKRRLAAGEFPALHAAQAAVAREHGLPSWAALKQLIDDQTAAAAPGTGSHALTQLRWIADRFAGADQPGWLAPTDSELREHIADSLLDQVPAAELVRQLSGAAADLRRGLTVLAQEPLEARVRVADLEYVGVVDAEPPHRLTRLLAAPPSGGITDPRLAAPHPAQVRGDAPADLVDAADQAFADLGLVSLMLAGAGPSAPPWTARPAASRPATAKPAPSRPGAARPAGADAPAWVVEMGWANLDQGQLLDSRHRLQASGITPLVTATAALRLVADGRLDLDAPANDVLHAVRLADDGVTVRELLSHSGGVDSPPPAELFADRVPDLATLLGPVIGCGGQRGAVQPSNGGYGVLGQLIADVTGSPYAAAATRLVLEPLGMTGSAFPAAAADLGPDAVTGYNLNADGIFVPVPSTVCTLPAAAGLWATAMDIVRLATGWATLLPAELARAAVTPQTRPGPGGYRVGLGWLLDPGGDAALHAGAGPGATAVLLLRPRDGRLHIALTSRLVSLDPLNDRVLASWNAARQPGGAA